MHATLTAADPAAAHREHPELASCVDGRRKLQRHRGATLGAGGERAQRGQRGNLQRSPRVLPQPQGVLPHGGGVHGSRPSPNEEHQPATKRQANAGFGEDEADQRVLKKILFLTDRSKVGAKALSVEDLIAAARTSKTGVHAMTDKGSSITLPPSGGVTVTWKARAEVREGCAR